MSQDERAQRPKVVTEPEVLEALKVVEDPELGFDVVELGLIYGVEIDEKRCVVEMTLTSPGCPEGPAIVAAVTMAAKKATGLGEVTVRLVWDPPWDPDEMPDEDVRFVLRSFR
jgi:metal-sulfur cluster biosynthetic enzyme